MTTAVTVPHSRSHNAGGVLAVLVDLGYMVWVLFSRYHLPQGLRIRPERSRPARYTCIFIGAVGAIAALDFFTRAYRQSYISETHLPLLNGFASTVTLFLFGVQIVLFVAGVLQEDRKPSSGPPLSVAFVVPAHNEAHNIAEVIEALDVPRAGTAGAQYTLSSSTTSLWMRPRRSLAKRSAVPAPYR